MGENVAYSEVRKVDLNGWLYRQTARRCGGHIRIRGHGEGRHRHTRRAQEEGEEEKGGQAYRMVISMTMTRLSERKRFTVKDFERIDSLLYLANRNQLEQIKERVENEIRLSDLAIKEGYEKRPKLKKVI